MVESLRPDVILMDLRMPGLGGAAAIRALAERGLPARVLVLTTYDTDSDVVPALEAGATGYLLKDSPREELVRAIRAAARGEAVLAPSVATRLVSQLRAPAPGRLERAGARGPDADRPGRDQSWRGGPPVHLRGDGQDAPAPHLREARRQRPRRGGRRGLRARPACAAPKLSQGIDPGPRVRRRRRPRLRASARTPRCPVRSPGRATARWRPRAGT